MNAAEDLIPHKKYNPFHSGYVLFFLGEEFRGRYKNLKPAVSALIVPRRTKLCSSSLVSRNSPYVAPRKKRKEIHSSTVLLFIDCSSVLFTKKEKKGTVG